MPIRNVHSNPKTHTRAFSVLRSPCKLCGACVRGTTEVCDSLHRSSQW